MKHIVAHRCSDGIDYYYTDKITYSNKWTVLHYPIQLSMPNLDVKKGVLHNCLLYIKTADVTVTFISEKPTWAKVSLKTRFNMLGKRIFGW